MGLTPGEGNESEAPPNQTARVWFLRGCVGLAFTLWSTAMAQPLANIGGWGIIQTNQVYPLATGH